MAQIIIENDNLSVTFTSASNIDLQDPNILEFMRLLGLFHELVSLDTLDVDQLGSGIYKFEFRAADGRAWKQRLSVLTPVDRMTFNGNVTDFWEDGELPIAALLRDQIFLLIRNPPTLTKIVADWA